MYTKRQSVNRFFFGEDNKSSEQSVVIQARSFEEAAAKFRATCINPVRLVCSEDYIRDADNCFVDNEEKTTDYEPSYIQKENPRIKVEEQQEQSGEWVDIATHYILLSECIDVDYSTFKKVGFFLESQGAPVEKSNETALVVPGSINNKSELISKRNELAKAQQRLEMESRNLKNMIAALNKEISEKKRLLHGIEIYTGVGCETFEIKDGTPAPIDAKLHLYQQTLFIDEELSIWENCWEIEGGADYENLEDFESFIKENYERFMPQPLSITVWRIRRHEKEYGDFWEGIIKNQHNFITIFLLRDGERLVEFIPEITIGNILFPKTGDLQQVIEDARGWSNEKERIEEYMNKHVFSLLFLQGLIDNTDVLPARFKGENLCSGISEKIVFVRDAEMTNLLQDGRPSWDDFIKKNRELIDVGSRIVYLQVYRSDYNRNLSYERSGVKYFNEPEVGIYTVTEKHESHWGPTLRFSYLPTCEVYDEDGFHERKRKAGWRFYSDEAINLDAITLEEVDYYLNNRIYREQYVRMMPALFTIRKFLSREQEEADNFKAFIRGQLKFEVEDGILDEAISDFKTKRYGTGEERKWKRGLMDEDGAAVIQIEKIIKKKVENK